MQPASPASPASARSCQLPPRTRPARRHVRSLRVPVETVLTPVVLIGAACRLPDAELERMIEALIAETDARAGDTDLEPDDDL